MKINRLACLFMLSMLLPAAGNAQQRQEMLLEKGWKFTREDNKGFSQSQWDDKKMAECDRTSRLGDLRTVQH